MYCPCPERDRLWGKFWWVEREHRWIFFDDREKSETYAEHDEYCPACGRPLEREELRMIGPVERSR